MAHTAVDGSHRHPPPLLWETDENFGTVHLSGCNVCGPYIKHLIAAAFDNDLSFQRARKGNRVAVAADIEEQHNHTHDREVGVELAVCQDELRIARESQAVLRAELRAAQNECKSLRSGSAEAVINGPHSSTHGSKHPDYTTHSPSSTNSSLSAGSFATPSAEMEELPLQLPADVSAGISAGGSMADESAPTMSSNTPSESNHEIENRLPELRSWNATAQLLKTTRKEGVSTITAPIVSPTTINSSSLAPASSAPSWQVAGRAIKTPKSIKQMDSLLAEAHKTGNIDHYKKVKELCAEAHAALGTKTNLQKYLLVKWKTPDWVRGPRVIDNLPSHPPTNPLRDDPAEDWVAYYTIFPASLPLGVRLDGGGKPLLSDMRASRTMARLRPDMVVDGPTTAQARLQFKEVAIHLFSNPHTYQRLTSNGAAIATHISYAPFSGSLDEITPINISMHFAACGITVDAAHKELGPWARECLRVWDVKNVAGVR